MAAIDSIRHTLTRYRDLLANLSRRNRELYFRESKSFALNLTKAPVAPEDAGFDVSKSFSPLRLSQPAFRAMLDDGSLDLTSHLLLDQLRDKNTLKRLDKLRVSDDKFQREFGISGAWLLGPFLCWRDSNEYKQSDLLISPMLKLPVNLLRDKRKNWTLELEDSQLSINPTLQLALKQKWGIELPNYVDSEDPQETTKVFAAALQAAGKSLETLGIDVTSPPKIPSRFKIVKDEEGNEIGRQPVSLEEALSESDLAIYQKTTNKKFYVVDAFFLDHLNANRAVLLSDYDDIMSSTVLHPILSELFLGVPVPSTESKGRDRSRELDGYKERDNYFVVDIDSTQHRAIDAAKKSRAIVIQGPPGTGKSQTITNLIADNLANGKKVLFVSEKRPALDVVYSRLQQAGIHNQSVLIHSSELNKQDLYKSFLSLVDVAPDATSEKNWTRVGEDLDRTKTSLNSYFTLLESTHQVSGRTISELFSSVAEFAEVTPNHAVSELFGHLCLEDLDRVAMDLGDLEQKVLSVRNFWEHPWRTRRQGLIYTESFESKFKTLVEETLDAVASVELSRQQLLDLTGHDTASSLPSAAEIRATLVGIPAPFIHRALTEIYRNGSEYEAAQSRWEEPLREIERNRIAASAIRPGTDVELVATLEQYFIIHKGFFSLLKSEFRRNRRRLKEIATSSENILPSLTAYRSLREAVGKLKTSLSVSGIEIDFTSNAPEDVKSRIEEISVSLKRAVDLRRLVERTGERVFHQFEDLENGKWVKLNALMLDIAACLEMHESATLRLRTLISKIEQFFEAPPLDAQVSSAKGRLEELLRGVQDLNALDAIDQKMEEIRQATGGKPVRNLFSSVLSGTSGRWGHLCKGAVIKGWIDDLRQLHPLLRTFSSAQLSKEIDRFKAMELSHKNTAREAVSLTASTRWNQGYGEGTGVALLKKEAAKQRKILSPREIMERGALTAMMKLKPCWLMSPLSISQLLPLKAELFDTIIFDEASQVRVEDAVPSIFRAKSMVVVGDNKQMPPTNFFSSSAPDEDDDDDDEVEIAQSILDLASQVYPSELLEWHYRSRTESLIAFSNRAYYGGRLIASPNPHLLCSGNAFQFHRIKDGYFNQKDGNEGESRAVVDKLVELLSTNPKKSVGIIALGQSQMAAIESELEKRMDRDSGVRELVEKAQNFKDGDADAGLFIKNLENVQGDERDIILLSCGYGPSGPDKKLRLNFGPISKQGGGRRLNVAITRAKQAQHVFCSFDPNSIPTDESAFGDNPDSCCFGRFLKYARAIHESRNDEALAILNSFGIGGVVTTRKSSNFSRDVARRLGELGHHVSQEIGSSGFFIDIGIHHPSIPTNFVVGIECDGAFFHSSPYARDRDKIREALLVSRGWKIIRVWSQDWSKNWRAEVERVDNLIREILESSKKAA